MESVNLERPTISSFLGPELRALEAALQATLPRVYARLDDEAVHDMRVAIRRMRVVLRLARKPYGRYWADHVRKGFTAIHRSSSVLRDEEVFLQTLAGLKFNSNVFAQWCKQRQTRQGALRRRVLSHLRTGVLDRSIQLLEALILLPCEPKRDRDLPTFAIECVEAARTRVDEWRNAKTDDTCGLHELRIAYKNLRYAAEILAPVLPIDLSALAKPAATFQKRLGEIHDLDVAHISIGRARSLPHTVKRRVLRLLADARAHAVEKYESEMRPRVLPPLSS